MSLTGRPLLVLLFLACVALPVVGLMLWGRLHPRAVAVVVVLVLVGAGELAAVGLAAAAVNRSGGYFTTWAQVGSTFSTPPGISRVATRSQTGSSGASTASAGSLTTKVVKSFSTPARRSTQGELEAINLTGGSSQLSTRAFVYLPPEYFKPAYKHTEFPTAEVFTGYPGKERILLNALDYPGVLRSEVAAGRARPMILVMLRPSITYPRDTECTDVPGGPQALTFFSQDVPAAMNRHYRVLPNDWGTIGDSTGGYCSAKLAMMYPATFRAAASLSGYYQALKDHTTGDLWGGSRVLRNLNDLRWRLAHLPAPDTSLLVTISREERGRLGYVDTEQFLKRVKPPMRVDSTIVPHGGHNFMTWSALMPQSLDWLSARLLAAGGHG